MNPDHHTETDSTGAPLAGDASAEPIHKRVFEYDGAFWCRDCGAQWGALPGKPVMPDMCQQAAAPVRGAYRYFKNTCNSFTYRTDGETLEFLWQEKWTKSTCLLTDLEKPEYFVSLASPAPAPDAGSPIDPPLSYREVLSAVVMDLEMELDNRGITGERWSSLVEARRVIAELSTPPAPAPDAGDIESQVCADIKGRQQAGIAKYGTTVSANPLPLSEWLQHAYEEALDMAIYLKRSISELK